MIPMGVHGAEKGTASRHTLYQSQEIGEITIDFY
jgi:hypothetical protein